MLVALHADDLGFSATINAGICGALRGGLLTGASVLANAPETEAALAAWRRLEEDRRGGGLPSAEARRLVDDPARPFDLGVHLNVSQGRPVTGAGFPVALLDAHGRFDGMRTFARLLLPGAARHAAAVRRELAAQVELVLDHGVRPVRFDGHQYCELTPVVGRIVVDLAARYGVSSIRVAREPGLLGTLVRGRRRRRATQVAGELVAAAAKRALATMHIRRARRARLRHPHWFFGSVSAGVVDPAVLERFLALAGRLRAESIEIGLHPALPAQGAAEESEGRDAAWHDPLAAVRPAEYRWLTDDRLPIVLHAHGARLGRLA